jgi:HlyD family secretion protein
MSRVKRLRILVLAAAIAGALSWWMTRPADDLLAPSVYGSVELREVALAFGNHERIAEVLVEEGDRVRRGQVLARQDTRKIEASVAFAEARVAAQAAALEKLRNGSRAEEIEQARSLVAAARADAGNARRQHDRVHGLSRSDVASAKDVDDADTAMKTAAARFAAAEKALALLVLGPRTEDIAAAEAQLRADEAQLALLREQLEDCDLVAPADSVVRTRLMEPGEMASPDHPVFSLAVGGVKWVRAYLPETSLGVVRPGAKASVLVDSFPGRRFDAWVGFISPVAEFTPRSVQTEELRTSLVYETRVFVVDSADDLRLGMPATVRLHPEQAAGAGEGSDRPAAESDTAAPTSASE